MDLWVVAAATGAGYIAKYWQNLSGEKEGSTESRSIDTIHGQSESHNSLQRVRDRNWHLGKSAQNTFGRDVSFDRDQSDERFSESNRLGRNLAGTGEASTSGGYSESLANWGNSGDCNVISLASVPPLTYGRESYQGIGDGSEAKRGFYNKSGGETSYFHKLNNRSRLPKRRRPYGYSSKSLNSLESCLTAQLYREHAKMEEYVFSSLPSPSTQMVRPLLVTDGSQIISRASSDFKAEMRFNGGEHRKILGASSLPKISMEFQRRPRQSFGKVQSRRMSNSFPRVSAVPFNSQGSPNGMLLLFLGITVGIISTGVANKREVDKLNELLKQSENLVQDLHDELEMKDLLTMKELPGERFDSSETDQHLFFDGNSTTTFTEQELDASRKCDSNDSAHQKADYSESMSKIEAELEAELERLELNMKASRLERISDVVELEPDFVADMVEGELSSDKVNKPGGSSDSDSDVSGTSTNHNDTANYAVSPWELSLRLHEIIQSNLEARIAELETALQENQKRISSMEFEHINSQRDFYSEVETSSTQESPAFVDEGDEIDRPLVINLSGEALDAYNEAYEEIFRMTKTEEEAPPDTMYPGDQEKDVHYQGQNGEDEFNSHCDITEERLSGSLVHDKSRTWEEHASKSRESDEIGESEDDDEIGTLLIKQIVEKARQGSPVVLNAQRMLYSIDDQ